MDEAGAPAATIEITDHGVHLCLFSKMGERTLSPLEVQHESSALATLRGKVAAATSLRYEVLLRTVGRLLEKEYAPSYRFLVTPELIGVHCGTGHYASFSGEELFAQEQASRRQRRSGKT